MTLRVKFHSTGEGYVLCRRFYENGSEAPKIRYYKGQSPLLHYLTPKEGKEFSLAYEIEFGEKGQ